MAIEIQFPAMKTNREIALSPWYTKPYLASWRNNKAVRGKCSGNIGTIAP